MRYLRAKIERTLVFTNEADVSVKQLNLCNSFVNEERDLLQILRLFLPRFFFCLQNKLFVQS